MQAERGGGAVAASGATEEDVETHGAAVDEGLGLRQGDGEVDAQGAEGEVLRHRSCTGTSKRRLALEQLGVRLVESGGLHGSMWLLVGSTCGPSSKMPAYGRIAGLRVDILGMMTALDSGAQKSRSRTVFLDTWRKRDGHRSRRRRRACGRAHLGDLGGLSLEVEVGYGVLVFRAIARAKARSSARTGGQDLDEAVDGVDFREELMVVGVLEQPVLEPLELAGADNAGLEAVGHEALETVLEVDEVEVVVDDLV